MKDIFGNPFTVFDPALITEKWSGRWIGTNEALHEEFGYDMENWVVVNTLAELDEAVRLGKYLSKDFPAGTYLPPLDKIYREYSVNPYVLEGKYNSRYPFGTRTEFDQLPFKFVNFIMLLPNVDEERPYYTCVLQEAVYNIDGTIGMLSIPMSLDEELVCMDAVWSLMAGTDHSIDGDEYILPKYDWMRAQISNRQGWNRFIIDFYKRSNLLDKNGNLYTGFKQLITQWFDTGILPKELERIYVWGPTRTFKKWD